MKTVILAGGFGTRISEESYVTPKPMIEIGERPILWHIMKIYSHYGFNDFIICLGYKGNIIKQFFSEYYLRMSDVTFDFSDKNNVIIHDNVAEPWRVTLVETGLSTQTGGRLKRVQKHIGNEPFMLTYGDGVCNVNIAELCKYHEQHGATATLTAIQPGGRFGMLDIDRGGGVTAFTEKAKEEGGWINGGYMVMQPEIFNYLDGDDCVLENKPMRALAEEGRLAAFQHGGYWQCMDTQRDKNTLEKEWASPSPAWKVWH